MVHDHFISLKNSFFKNTFITFSEYPHWPLFFQFSSICWALLFDNNFYYLLVSNSSANSYFACSLFILLNWGYNGNSSVEDGTVGSCSDKAVDNGGMLEAYMVVGNNSCYNAFGDCMVHAYSSTMPPFAWVEVGDPGIGTHREDAGKTEVGHCDIAVVLAAY